MSETFSNSVAAQDQALRREKRAKTFDLVGSLARLDGNDMLLRKLIQFFCEDAPGLLAQVQSGLAQGQAEMVERGAHSLKGLVANFGASETFEAARRIEDAAQRHDLTAVEQELPNLEVQLKLLREELACYEPPKRCSE